MLTQLPSLLREVQAGPTFVVTDAGGIAARQAVLRDSGLPRIAEAADVLARFDREAEYGYAVSLAIEVATLRIAELQPRFEPPSRSL